MFEKFLGKMATGSFLQQVGKAIGKHAPEIFTVAAIACDAGIIYSSYKAHERTAEYEPVFQQKLVEVDKEDTEAMKALKKEALVEKAKTWLPVVGFTGLNVVCTVASNRSSAKRIQQIESQLTEMINLYTITKAGEDIYKDKTKQIAGPTKAADIQAERIKEEVRNDDRVAYPNPDNIVDTGEGDFLFKERNTNIWLKGDAEKIREHIEFLDKQLNPDQYGLERDPVPYISVGEYLDALRIPRNKFINHDELRWTPGMSMEPMFDYTSDDYGNPVGYISTASGPKGRKALVM